MTKENNIPIMAATLDKTASISMAELTSDKNTAKTTKINQESFSKSEKHNYAAEIGKSLEYARLQKSMTVEQYAECLKVSPAKLFALEIGDLTKMPDITFAIGLLRGYAKCLNINPLPLIEKLRMSDHALNSPNSTERMLEKVGLRSAHVPLAWSSRRSGRTWLWSLLGAVLILIFLIIWRINNGTENWLNYFKMNNVHQKSIHNNTNHKADLLLNSNSHESKKQTVLNEKVAIESVDYHKEKPNLDNNLSPMPVTINNAQSEVGIEAVSPLKITESASNVVNSSANAKQTAKQTISLKLNTSAETWVSIKQRDGKTLFVGTLKANTDNEYLGKSPIRVVIGNTRAISSFTQNGKAIDNATLNNNTKNNVARFTLP